MTKLSNYLHQNIAVSLEGEKISDAVLRDDQVTTLEFFAHISYRHCLRKKFQARLYSSSSLEDSVRKNGFSIELSLDQVPSHFVGVKVSIEPEIFVEVLAKIYGYETF